MSQLRRLATTTARPPTVSTTGNPYLFGSDAETTTQTFDGCDAQLGTMSSNALTIGRYFCLTRNYCGRDGGQPGPSGNGDVNRLFLVGDWNANGSADNSQYRSSDERIMIGADDRNDADVFAHEYGHLIDHHFRDDYIAGFHSREVTEALANMFFMDARRRALYSDGDSLGDGDAFTIDYAATAPGWPGRT